MAKVRMISVYIKKSIYVIAAVCMAVALSGCGSVDLRMYDSNSSEESTTSAPAGTTAPETKAPETTAAVAVLEPTETYGDDFVRCEAAICYDLTEEKILYAKNADEKIYPASTTKILTALTAIEYTAPEYVYYVGSELDLVAQDSSMSWIAQGSSLCRNEILTAMLAPSGNDAAYCIAANVARKIYGEELSDTETIDYFAVLMNDYAKKLGAENTHFTVPDGYHDDEHYTTASDMLKFAIAAAQSKTCLQRLFFQTSA